MARPSRGPSVARFLILVAIVGVILFFLGRLILGIFTGGAQADRARVTLDVLDTPVNVAVDGGLLQRADDDSTVFAGDRVTTGNGGSALLEMIDGTVMRLDAQTDVTVAVSEQDEEETRFTVALDSGALWVETPSLEAFTGAAVRSVTTGQLTMGFGPGTKAVVVDEAVLVFEDGGRGVTVTAEGADGVEVSEGQRFVLDGDMEGDLSSHRSALTPEDWQDPFVKDGMGTPAGSGSTDIDPSDVTGLTVTSPKDKAVIAATTVKVEGSVGPDVARVRVNGYSATFGDGLRNFSQELALPAAGEMDILVEALDASGVVTAQVRRTVTRESAAMGSPTVTEPAKTGETYTTDATELVLRGTSPAGAAGMMVNDYKLQLFKPELGTWSYLATTQLGNLKPGTNEYLVYALAADGTKSQPAKITIVLGSASATSAGSSTVSVSSTPDETTLPQNDPLQPGTLKVTTPTAGTEHTETGTGVLIEGTTAGDTASIWVNGYKLQLYQPGRRTWNYLAQTSFGNLRRGRNVYKVTARDAQYRVLDRMEYVIILDPR
jgi:hypothetical protein